MSNTFWILNQLTTTLLPTITFAVAVPALVLGLFNRGLKKL